MCLIFVICLTSTIYINNSCSISSSCTTVTPLLPNDDILTMVSVTIDLARAPDRYVFPLCLYRLPSRCRHKRCVCHRKRFSRSLRLAHRAEITGATTRNRYLFRRQDNRSCHTCVSPELNNQNWQ